MRDYETIPGTYVFDGRRSIQGYALNMFCMSLNAAANRAAFKADPKVYLDGHALTDRQRQAVEARDWLLMLQLGGNIYYTYKLAAFDGLNMQDVGAQMSGVSTQDFSQMMVDGGRRVEGNRHIDEIAERTNG